jgi:hypothetical protein
LIAALNRLLSTSCRELSAIRRFDEWHLVILNLFEHLAFDHVPGLKHRVVFLGPSFSQSRFDSIRTVGNSMSGDGVEHLLVEILPSRSITQTLYGDHSEPVRSSTCLVKKFLNMQ